MRADNVVPATDADNTMSEGAEIRCPVCSEPVDIDEGLFLHCTVNDCEINQRPCPVCKGKTKITSDGLFFLCVVDNCEFNHVKIDC